MVKNFFFLAVLTLATASHTVAKDLSECGGTSVVAKKSDFGTMRPFDSAWLIPQAISEAHAKFVPSLRCVGFPIGTPCTESIGLSGDITFKAPPAMVAADPGRGTGTQQ